MYAGCPILDAHFVSRVGDHQCLPSIIQIRAQHEGTPAQQHETIHFLTTLALLEPKPVIAIVLGRVREDDFVARFQAF